MFLFSRYLYVKLKGFRVVMAEVVSGGDVSVSPSSIPVSSTAGYTRNTASVVRSGRSPTVELVVMLEEVVVDNCLTEIVEEMEVTTDVVDIVTERD